jgi:cell wall-associated NlpC family hydrolase
MQTVYEPQLGDYGVLKTGGWIGSLIRLGTRSRWNHAVVYIGEGNLVEANPTGIEIHPVTKYPLIAWNRHEDELTDDTRNKIVDEALRLVGGFYGFADIAVLVLRILGLRLLANTTLLDRLAEKEGFICSELVSHCYREAGFVVIPNMEDHLVTPGDLAERLIYM